jgi:hypothetical protein
MANQVEAVLDEVIHLGDLIKYRARTKAGEELSIKSVASSQPPLAIGSPISIAWQPDDALLLFDAASEQG